MGIEGAPKASRNLHWLDYLRFIAAAAVMLFHYLANGPRHSKTGSLPIGGLVQAIAEYGYLGVDVFFLVSGFVILFSAGRSRPDQFAVSRAVRLWATFALCMTLTAVAKNLWAAPDDHVGLIRYLVNLTMVPAWLGVQPVDGVYWTLALELLFYAAVFVVLALGQMHRIRGILTGWIGLLVAARAASAVWDLPSIPLLGGYFDLFAAGCVLALMRREGADRLLWILLAVSVALVLQGVHARAIVLAADRTTNPAVAAAVVAVSLIPFLVFMRRGPNLPLARDVGRITYPLYLLHAHIGYIALRALDMPVWIEVPLVAAVAIAAAWLVYRLFEGPTEDFRRRAFDLTLGAAVRRVTGGRPGPAR